MTERMPFPEDIFRESIDAEYEDMQQVPTWKEFSSTAINVAKHLHEDPDLKETQFHVMAIEEGLDDVLGDDYLGRECKVLARACALDTQTDEFAAESTVLDTDSGVYHGLIIRRTDSEWRAYLKFYKSNHTDESPHGYYAVLLSEDMLMDFHSKPKEKTAEEEMRDIEEENLQLINNLQQVVASSRAQVMFEEFPEYEPFEQRMVLENMAQNAEQNIPGNLRDCNVTIACKQYYTVFDDMTELDMRHCFTDHTFSTDDFDPALSGTIQRIEYPELAIAPKDKRLTPVDLYLNDGAPCLVVRDQLNDRTHYILPQSIDGIV